MFEHQGENRVVAVQPLLQWFADLAATGPYGEQAKALLAKAGEVSPAFHAYRTTPQGGPWHCEGPVVADHVLRMLTCVIAINDGASLVHVEEFAREKDLVLEVAALEATIRKHEDFLLAFALVHDIAKPATLSFTAPHDTRGGAEGFVARAGNIVATAPEKVRYDKLYRAFAAANPTLSTPQCVQKFYEEYGIATHYIGHESAGASPDYAPARDAALSLVGLTSAHAKMLSELIRYHIDVLHAFHVAADRKKYEVMVARAGKAGVNVDVFLDLMAAVAFLDSVVGGIVDDHGTLSANTDLLIHILRAEREAVPTRHALRVERDERAGKQAYKDALAAAGLDGESVFALLGTPYGPVRGQVMADIHRAITDAEHVPNAGAQTAEILARIARFHVLAAEL